MNWKLLGCLGVHGLGVAPLGRWCRLIVLGDDVLLCRIREIVGVLLNLLLIEEFIKLMCNSLILITFFVI